MGVVIFYNQMVSTSGEELAYVAGTIIQEDAIVTNSGQLCFRVSLRESSDKDFEKKASNGMASQTLQLGVKQKEYPLVFTCSTPVISHTHANKLGMDFFGPCACGDLAHPECLPKSVSESVAKGAQYQCTPFLATELFPGVMWSEPPATGREQMVNTCPIDNFLTALGIFMEEQNADLETFFPADEQHQHLRDTLNLIRRKKFNLAQTKNYQKCKKMNDDFLALPTTKELEKSINEFNKRHKEVMKKNAG